MLLMPAPIALSEQAPGHQGGEQLAVRPESRRLIPGFRVETTFLPSPPFAFRT